MSFTWVVGFNHIWWIQVWCECHWRNKYFQRRGSRFGKKESMTGYFNKSHDKFQTKQKIYDKADPVYGVAEGS